MGSSGRSDHRKHTRAAPSAERSTGRQARSPSRAPRPSRACRPQAHGDARPPIRIRRQGVRPKKAVLVLPYVMQKAGGGTDSYTWTRACEDGLQVWFRALRRAERLGLPAGRVHQHEHVVSRAAQGIGEDEIARGKASKRAKRPRHRKRTHVVALCHGEPGSSSFPSTATVRKPISQSRHTADSSIACVAAAPASCSGGEHPVASDRASPVSPLRANSCPECTGAFPSSGDMRRLPERTRQPRREWRRRKSIQAVRAQRLRSSCPGPCGRRWRIA